MNRLLYVLLLSPLLTSAQATIDTLHWSATRRLQLSDFRSPTHAGLGGSDFHYQLNYEVRPTSLWSEPAIDAYCLMFRNLSWISETAKNERTLAYNQVLFDLVEIHARQMKAKLIALKAGRHFKEQAKQIEYLTNSELGSEVNRFRSETGGGDDVQILQTWQKQVIQRLYEIPVLVTTYHSSKVGFGVFFGGGGALPTGSLHQTLSPPVGLSMGIEIALRRTMLLVQPTDFNAQITQTFTHQGQSWEDGMRVKPGMLEIGVGHWLYDSPRYRIIPYVGYRLLDLSPRDRFDERYKGLSLINHAPTVGLIVDYKLGDNTEKADLSHDSFWFVRTKLSFSPLVGADPLSGGLLNLQIGLGGFGRIRKVSYKPDRTVLPLSTSGF